jgi:hypothetical protein
LLTIKNISMITYIYEHKEPHGHKEESSHGIERC